MGIQEDAAELLVFVYKRYTSSENFFNTINHTEFINETSWDIGRIRRAIDYLYDKAFINVRKFLGGNFFIDKLYPEGIEIVENKDKFKTTFGFGINLGVFQFSWTKEKK